jgi:hypothetical protein
MSQPDDLWCILATKNTHLRVFDQRDHYIPAGDIERFRRHAPNGQIGLCPRRSNATDGEAAAPCVWVHYQPSPRTKLPGVPALIIDHGAMRTAIWWLETPLRREDHPDDSWLRKANMRLHYRMTGQNSQAPSAQPMWLMPPGDTIHRQPHMSTTAFLKALKPSPWERDAHKRPARTH